MAALVVIGGVFSVVILLQQQASATAIITPAVSHNNKCSGDIITCTHNKKTQHSTKGTTTPFDLPLPFP
jgi:hypothetical protein